MLTDRLRIITEAFVKQSAEILGDNLVGIYLHGSAAMGCFNDVKSDIDLLVVVKDELSLEDKLCYMDMVVKLNALAPTKGIELSVIRKSVCKPFIYPTPFEIHFSIAHIEWYQRDPHDYVLKMNGNDKDLAAHIKITYHRGLCLFGSEIQDIFEDVDDKAYLDSILNDIENAAEDILEMPVYTILNLCRVLAYKKEKLIMSKQEGGKWGLENVPARYTKLIQAALDDYSSEKKVRVDEKEASEYAKYMLNAILTCSNEIH